MKVLRVHNHYQQDGGESAVERAERELLRRRGCELCVYERHNREIEPRGPGRARLALDAIWSARSHRELRALVARERPDVAHFTNTFPLISPSAYEACHEAGIPVVQSLHNYRLLCPAADFLREGRPCEDCVDHGLWRGVRHACYRGSRPATAVSAAVLAVHRARGTYRSRVDRFVALSDFARSRFLRGGLPPERIEVIPNCVDPDPGPRPDPGPGGHALFVGRLSPEKGVETLLEAWRQLAPELPLEIVGDGPLRGALEQRVRQAGLRRVRLRGALPRSGVLGALQRARFLVVPSLCYENFPLVIAEAYARGVPVLASDRGALGELVEEGRTGLRFLPGDARDLARRVRQAWADAKRTRDWGLAARARFEERYTAERKAERLLDLYARLQQPSSRTQRQPSTARQAPRAGASQ